MASKTLRNILSRPSWDLDWTIPDPGPRADNTKVVGDMTTGERPNNPNPRRGGGDYPDAPDAFNPRPSLNEPSDMSVERPPTLGNDDPVGLYNATDLVGDEVTGRQFHETSERLKLSRGDV